MREQSPTYFYGIDIGSQNIRCIVGIQDQNDPSNLSVIGHGIAETTGMRKGTITHSDEVAECVVKAVTEAERVSGASIHSATVNINGSHIQGINSRGVIAISTADKEISQSDRLRVEEAAATMKLPPNREIIQVFSRNYRVDGQDNIKDPVGMQGVRLEVDAHIVTATTPNIKNMYDVLQYAKIHPNRFTFSGLAAAEATLSRKQREAGTVLLDIGAGTTNVIIVEDGEIQHVAVIPMGGVHITNDLAIGLKTDLEIAELVKIKHGTLDGSSITESLVEVSYKNIDYQFDARDIHMIIDSRVEELFEFIEKELRRVGKAQKLPGGAVIVGGTAQLQGVADYAKEKLQLAARIGTMHQVSGLVDTVSSPQYATAIGLMMLDMYLGPDEMLDQGEPNNNVFRLIDGFLGFRNRFKNDHRGNR